MSNTVSQEDLLAMTKRRYDYVNVSGGKQVRIQSLSELEKSDFETELMKKKGEGLSLARLRHARQRLIALTAVNDEGALLFNGDATGLNDVDGAITALIYDRARSHCGFEKDDIENLVKNSEGTPAEDSPTN